MKPKRTESNSRSSGHPPYRRRPTAGESRGPKLPRPSIRYAQNFLKDPGLVASIITGVDLDKDDLVYEIGPGQGIITSELSKVCARVVAVEIEPRLYEQLKAQFRGVDNVELINADFLKLALPAEEYKVFSNIPFNLTADIFRKLLRADRPPAKAYLILQREAAEKYSGVPKETQVSISLKPWFSFSVLHRFERTDFDPVPSVDTVLLGIERRVQPLVPPDKAALYRRFIIHGFSRWKANLGKNYKKVFTHLQWKRLAGDLGFGVHAQPTDLSFDQWLGVFQFLLTASGKGQVRIPDELLTDTTEQTRG